MRWGACDSCCACRWAPAGGYVGYALTTHWGSGWGDAGASAAAAAQASADVAAAEDDQPSGTRGMQVTTGTHVLQAAGFLLRGSSREEHCLRSKFVGSVWP